MVLLHGYHFIAAPTPKVCIGLQALLACFFLLSLAFNIFIELSCFGLVITM